VCAVPGAREGAYWAPPEPVWSAALWVGVPVAASVVAGEASVAVAMDDGAPMDATLPPLLAAPAVEKTW
jgi:hypothetical protein